MRVRGSCVAREGLGVLITGPAGSGKSGLALRLRSLGFMLVADDLVDVDDGVARAPAALAGLMEVRGVGIVRVPHTTARLALVAELTDAPDRLPAPVTDSRFGLPVIQVRARAPDAAHVVALALDCATSGNCVVGAFAA